MKNEIVHILTIFKKDMKVQMKYRIIWINRLITPFFMLAPWVFTGNIFSHDLGISILAGGILWYWLNQLFFGVQDAFGDEREEGTLESVVLSPISLKTFIIGESVWVFVECIYITIVTLLMFALFGILSEILITGIFIYFILGFSLFSFSFFWAPLALLFRRLNTTSFIIQEGIGMLSGVTANIHSYPWWIRSFSMFIPLTFAIIFIRAYLQSNFSTMETSSILLLFLSIFYFIIGYFLFNFAEKKIRKEGAWGTW